LEGAGRHAERKKEVGSEKKWEWWWQLRVGVIEVATLPDDEFS